MLITIIVQTYRASENVKLIYDNFQIVLSILKSLDINFDFVSFKRSATACFSTLIIVYMTGFLICDDMEKMLGFYLIFTLYPVMIILFFVYFYVFQVDLVNWQLRYLIEAVKIILKVGDFQEQKNELLINCRKIFNTIFNTVSILNNVFGLMVMEIIIFTVILVTFNGYKIAMAFKDIKESIVFYGKLVFISMFTFK